MKIMRVSLLGMLAISSASLMASAAPARPAGPTMSQRAGSAISSTGSAIARAAKATDNAIADAGSAAYEAMPDVSGRLASGIGYNSTGQSGWNFTGAAKATGTAISSAANRTGTAIANTGRSIQTKALDFSNEFNENLQEQMGRGGNGDEMVNPTPQTMYQRASSAASKVYHTPGALVETMGGNGDFISGNENSFKSALNATGTAISSGAKMSANAISSAANATGTAIGNAGNAVYNTVNNAYQGSRAQQLASSAYNAPSNAYKAVNKRANAARYRYNPKNVTKTGEFDGYGYNTYRLKYSTAPVRGLDYTLTSVKNVKNYSAAKISELYKQLPTLSSLTAKLSFGKKVASDALQDTGVDSNAEVPAETKRTMSTIVSDFAKSITPNMSMGAFNSALSSMRSKISNLILPRNKQDDNFDPDRIPTEEEEGTELTSPSTWKKNNAPAREAVPYSRYNLDDNL